MRIVEIEAKSALTSTGGFLGDGAAGFTHTFSPAIGCALGSSACGSFCYAAFLQAHRLRGAAHGAWGEYLLVKKNAPEALRGDLLRAARRPLAHKAHLSKLRVFSASSTEPLAGPCFELYRRCLRVLAELPVASWVLQTRMPRVVELREECASLRGCLTISMTLETDDDVHYRCLPGGGPSIAARRRAVEDLSRLGIPVHVAVSPMLALRDPGEFVAWLADYADLVTVDTLTAGDGTGRGARSARSTAPTHLEAAGIRWRDDAPAMRFLEALRARIGERAAWSEAGFRRLAVGPARRNLSPTLPPELGTPRP
ncbi:MAG: radical SAM protein [Planctomycetes bacterium]|nr:radical SAM protein [Planctomycetota bacterium]